MFEYNSRPREPEIEEWLPIAIALVAPFAIIALWLWYAFIGQLMGH